MIAALSIATVVLAAVGFYIALYFSLVYYGVLKANSRMMPEVCRLEDKTCKTVIETPYGRVFGLPNSFLGAIYYTAVITLILTRQMPTALGLLLVVVSWFTVGLAVFLAYALFFIIRIPCPLCLTAHAINLTIACMLTYLGF